MNADDVFDVREVTITGVGGVRNTGILLIREQIFSPVKKGHVGSPGSFMRPRLRSVRMDRPFRKEGDVFDVEGLQSPQGFNFIGLRQRIRQRQEDFSGFCDRPQGHIPDNDLLHVELAHLERDLLKNPW